jgi:MSHA biogenesis protein MshI
MLGFGKTYTSSAQSLACYLSDSGYSLISLTDKKSIRLYEQSHFSEPSQLLIANSLVAAVEKHELYGVPCQIILAPSLYQLHLMDVPQVPEEEIAKALRWQLKGLIDYPLNDIAVDAFLVPPHGVGTRRKKVFAAITLQSALLNKISFLEQCLLNVAAVSIAEMALSKLISLLHLSSDAPCLVISFDEEVCQLHLYYEDNLYLYRTLFINRSITQPNASANQDMLLEIQRSIDYCLTELKLPEPKRIVFTPSLYKATDLITFLKEALDKDVTVMDIHSFLPNSSMMPEDMAIAFYALGGAFMLAEDQRR